MSIETPPREIFKIDESAIDRELCQFGATLWQYCELEGQLRVDVDDKKAKLEKVEAEVDTEIRNTADKITVDKINREIKQHPKYQAALEDLHRARRNHNQARAITISLSAKRDCLIALSYRDRQMMKVGEY